MDFTIPGSTQNMIRVTRDFMRKEVYLLERDFLKAGFREMLPVLAEKREKVKEMGLWAPHLPAEYAGQGLSLLEFAHISEELGRSPLGHYIFNCQAPDVGNMEILMKYGTGEQKERYLVPLVQGEIRSCFAMTEPGYPGSNPAWMGTTAVKAGDDYVLNGEKWFTAQQIYARYKAGLTKDERFATMIYVVQTLGKTAGLAIEKGRIDSL